MNKLFSKNYKKLIKKSKISKSSFFSKKALKIIKIVFSVKTFGNCQNGAFEPKIEKIVKYKIFQKFCKKNKIRNTQNKTKLHFFLFVKNTPKSSKLHSLVQNI